MKMAEDEMMMNVGTATKPFSVIEEGSLKLNNPDVSTVLYHQSLNVLLGFSSTPSDAGNHQEQQQQPGVVVLDIASGTLLHDTREPTSSSKKSGAGIIHHHTLKYCHESFIFAFHFAGAELMCMSVPERGTLVLAKGSLLGVRRDLGKTLLLESMLQPAVSREDDVVKLELPHAEAMVS